MAIMRILIIGAGRAGRSFTAALGEDHDVTLVHHDGLPTDIDVDLVLLCVPDDAIEEIAREVRVSPDTVVAHVAGSRGLDVLVGHARVGSLHPLLTMPDASIGARRLRGGVFAVEGDVLLGEVIASLGARTITVPVEMRTLYHATATSAANHLVAMMGHVQALAHAAGLELDDFLPLAQQSLDDVEEFGPGRALTGPASRGDVATIAAHLEAIPDEERATYAALAERARRLADTVKATSWNA
jgi:predicted short-subunit dehydrogenase-like oxidoreductase (DUF2520 family)